MKATNRPRESKKSSVLPLPTIRELFPKKRRPDNPKEKTANLCSEKKQGTSAAASSDV